MSSAPDLLRGKTQILSVNISSVCLWLAMKEGIFLVETTNKNMTLKQKLNVITDRLY